MPKVKLHAPYNGKQAGTTLDVKKEEADWLVAMGYGAKAADKPPAKSSSSKK